MKKIILLTAFLIVAVAVAAGLYFSNLSEHTRKNDKALSFIPNDAGFVVGLRYDDTFKDIFKDYVLFDSIIGQQKTNEIKQLQSSLLTVPEIRQALSEQSFFLSFHSTPREAGLLLLSALQKDITYDDIKKAAESNSEIKFKNILLSEKDAIQVDLPSLASPFYVYLDEGVAVGSFSKALLEKAVEKTAPKIDEEFIAEINASGEKNENSPVNIFINHDTFKQYISTFFRRRTNGILSPMKDLRGFATLNMNFKSDALMFNGLTNPDTSNKNYINLFLNQKPVKNTLKSLIPASTAGFIAWGISDFQKFTSDLRILHQKRGELQRLTLQVDNIARSTGINLEKDVKPLWGQEIASLELTTKETLALIKIKDGRKLAFFLEPISESASGDIRRFNNSNILYYYFGDPLKGFSRPYFAILDNYLIVANTISTINQYLRSYTEEKFLSKEASFVEFNQFVANESNISLFIHNRNAEKPLKSALNNYFANIYSGKNSGLKNFYGLSYQLSSDGDHFFTNLYANYKSSGNEQLIQEWKAAMNGRISLDPQIAYNKQGDSFILVQDRINNLYAFSQEGKRIWSSQLEGQILGGIVQLQDRSLVFNTAKRLYRIDPSGNNYPGFPVNLLHQASYGLTASSLNPQNSKIFIPCGNFILGFDPSGKVLSEWTKNIDGRILFDIKTTVLANTNYVIAGTDNGGFYFFNHTGNLIGKVSDPLMRQYRNPLSIETKSGTADSKIITTDTTGIVRSILFDGKVSGKTVGIWSPNHFFDMRNITADSNPEMLFLDKNQLYVYGSDSTLLFNYEFPNTITRRPKFFAESTLLYRLGIASDKDNLLYLFDRDGTMVKGFPFKGEPHFFVGSIKNDGKTYLICGKEDNNLYLYRL